MKKEKFFGPKEKRSARTPMAFVVENIKPQIESKTFILIAGYTLELSIKGLKP